MDKFNRNTWVKVPEFDSAPLSPYPKHRTDSASLIKPKGAGGERIELDRKGTSSC